MVGNAQKYRLWWPTEGEIDILEMFGGNKRPGPKLTDQYAHATGHLNNQSNTMTPVYNKAVSAVPMGLKCETRWSCWHCKSSNSGFCCGL